jgi:hypothetical protein
MPHHWADPMGAVLLSLFTCHEKKMIEELRQKYDDLAARAAELRRFL